MKNAESKFDLGSDSLANVSFLDLPLWVQVVPYNFWLLLLLPILNDGGKFGMRFKHDS